MPTMLPHCGAFCAILVHLCAIVVRWHAASYMLPAIGIDASYMLPAIGIAASYMLPLMRHACDILFIAAIYR